MACSEPPLPLRIVPAKAGMVEAGYEELSFVPFDCPNDIGLARDGRGLRAGVANSFGANLRAVAIS